MTETGSFRGRRDRQITDVDHRRATRDPDSMETATLVALEDWPQTIEIHQGVGTTTVQEGHRHREGFEVATNIGREVQTDIMEVEDSAQGPLATVEGQSGIGVQVPGVMTTLEA